LRGRGDPERDGGREQEISVHTSVSLRLGLKMATFDSDFRRVPGLEVVP